ncbi:nucleotidyltransferase domain-containing protein [Aquihabitans sp. McL0605]|uniref:nucleotidyltransferase domain-containing protein n=1 Tax=Aquihabitans sp. McL0605 TaxID=3415671 RepID=UPI003CF0FAD1
MGMEARDVLDIIAMFERAEIGVWVEGGWGIDALLGHQNRDHGDLDLVVDAPRAEDARASLRAVGFEQIFDDAPGRYSFMDGRERAVDLCFAAADRYGDRWNLNRAVGRGEPDYPAECFTYGWIGGQKVACLGPETQVLHHLGYETEDVDRWDVGLLRERFDVPLPESLR